MGLTGPLRALRSWRACFMTLLVLTLVVGTPGLADEAETMAGGGPSMPDMRGWAQAQAVATLEALGLAPEVVTVVDPAVGKVVAQQPEAGAALGTVTSARLVVGVAASAQVLVPDVVGLARAEAESVLDVLFFCEYVERADSNVAAGTVLEQSPAAGELAPFRSRLEVTVAGQATTGGLAMPDLVNLPLDVALQVVEALDLVAEPSFQPTSDGRMFVILSQGPVAGTRVARGSSVALVVSRPTGGSTQLRVPSVVGMKAESAKALLEGAGLVTSSSTRSSPLRAGTVLETSPVAGTSVAAGSTVSLVLSRGSGGGGGWTPGRRIEVPSLVGMTQSAARQALLARGLTAGMLLANAPDSPVGVVTAQRPSAGTRLVAGGAVTIYVPDSTRVPDLVGRTLVEARSALASTSLQAVERQVGPGGGYPRIVQSQDPMPGTPIAVGSSVTVSHVRSSGGGGGVIPDSRGVVPSFIGMSESEVTSAASAAGLSIRLTGLPASNWRRRNARASSQSVPAGTRVGFGGFVSVDFSGAAPGPGPGPRPGLQVRVPSFVGMDLSSADDLARQLGLVPAPRPPHGIRDARVSGQSLTAGSWVSSGSTISFTPGAPPGPDVGPGPGSGYLVPDMTNWSQGQAEAWASMRGLGTRLTSVEPGMPGARRIVRSTTPSAGQRIARHGTLTIQVGNASGTPGPNVGSVVIVPDVSGMTVSEAVMKLGSVRLTPVVPLSPDALRRATGTSPAAGSRVQEGTRVELLFR